MSIKSFISITLKSESKVIARRVRQSTNLHMIWDRQRAYNQGRTHKSNYRQSLSRFVHIHRYYPDIRWCRSSYSRLCWEWSPPCSCMNSCLVCWSKSADNMRHPWDTHSHLIKENKKNTLTEKFSVQEGHSWILTWPTECSKVFKNALFYLAILVIESIVISYWLSNSGNASTKVRCGNDALFYSILIMNDLLQTYIEPPNKWVEFGNLLQNEFYNP